MFNDVKEGEEVYSLVFGEGVVQDVLSRENRIVGFCSFNVRFIKKSNIKGFKRVLGYKISGTPDWCEKKGGSQTLFYTKDLSLTDLDFLPNSNPLTFSVIKKLRSKGKLDIRCPSGLWRNIDDAPDYFYDDAISNGHLYLFRISKQK